MRGELSMTRQQEVQALLDRIKNYVIQDDVTLECKKVEKAKAFIKMDNICSDNLNDEKCYNILKTILMQEIP
jgi:hypothetical protein